MKIRVKDINIKNHSYYFFNDIININVLHPNNIRTNENSYTNILICHIEYVTIKKDLKIYCVSPLYIIFVKVIGYFEKFNENNYLTPDPPSNES